MYVCIYVEMLGPEYVYVCVYVYVCMYVCMYVCVSKCSDLNMCMYVCMYVCMYIRMYACTYVRIYDPKHILLTGVPKEGALSIIVAHMGLMCSHLHACMYE